MGLPAFSNSLANDRTSRAMHELKGAVAISS